MPRLIATLLPDPGDKGERDRLLERPAFFDELVPPAEEEPAAPEYVQMGLEEAREDTPGEEEAEL